MSSRVKKINGRPAWRERFPSMSPADVMAPANPKVWAFAVLMRLGELPIIRQLKGLIALIFVDLAPAIPVSLRRSITGGSGPHAFALGFAITFFFCLVVPAAWTFWLGHFWPDASETTVTFGEDKPNLLLYSMICPLYVGLGCWLVVAAITGWSEVRSLATSLDPDTDEAPRRPVIKQAMLVVLILSMAFFSTANYIEDILDPQNVEKLYWFMERTASGEHTLNVLGVYYFLLNFSLLLITLISITLFMSIFVSTMAVGRALENLDQGSVDFAVLKAKLSVFTEVYILAKLLTFTYMVNFIIWQASPLGETQNILVAYVFLALFGVLFVSFPRYFVELQWFRFMVRSGQAASTENVEHEIRPFGIKLAATLVDTLLIGGFILGGFKDVLLKALQV